MRDMRSMMRDMDNKLTEIKAMLEATLPHLATKAELADLRGELRTGLAEKPSKLYMWGVMTALITAYGIGLAALAVLK